MDINYDELNSVAELEAALDQIEKDELEAARLDAIARDGLDDLCREEIRIKTEIFERRITIRKSTTNCKTLEKIKFALIRKLKHAHQ